MPLKSYSKEQRGALRMRLLQTGLALYSAQGIRNVILEDICKEVGISKPFFYTFFDSLQEFVICLLEYQWGILHQKIEEVQARPDLSWEDKIYAVLLMLIHYDRHGLLIMTQEEELWVFRRLGEKNVQLFLDRQVLFFQFLLEAWGIPEEKCPFEVLGNMIISILVVYNSARASLPFLYLDSLQDAAYAQARALILYLSSLQNDATPQRVDVD